MWVDDNACHSSPIGDTATTYSCFLFSARGAFLQTSQVRSLVMRIMPTAPILKIVYTIAIAVSRRRNSLSKALSTFDVKASFIEKLHVFKNKTPLSLIEWLRYYSMRNSMPSPSDNEIQLMIIHRDPDQFGGSTFRVEPCHLCNRISLSHLSFPALLSCCSGPHLHHVSGTRWSCGKPPSFNRRGRSPIWR